MLFNSYIFVFAFLPLVFFGFRLLSAKYPGGLWPFLVLSSVIFYGFWSPGYLILLVASTVFNFFLGGRLADESLRFRKQLCAFGVVVNLAVLMYYKYSAFLIENINSLIGANYKWPAVILPLGISFYTFQKIAYLLDCYREKKSERSFVVYALFVTFFPQLIAGPIVHHKQFIPQLRAARFFSMDDRAVFFGLIQFSVGLFKKVAIADSLSPWVSEVFDTTAPRSCFSAWIAVYAYAFQLYFDFSGYSDMAIGLARLFHTDLPVNFASPYKSCSISEFWRRWHITLSTFLRDYLYIPMGGSRYGRLREFLALWVTMLLGGLWHGASWTFVIWGALHALNLSCHRLWSIVSTERRFQLPVAVSWFFTFHSVVFAWIFFRATSIERAQTVLASMGTLKAPATPEVDLGAKLLSLVACLAVVLATPNTTEIIRWMERTQSKLLEIIAALAGAVIFTYSILNLVRPSEFIYYQF